MSNDELRRPNASFLPQVRNKCVLFVAGTMMVIPMRTGAAHLIRSAALQEAARTTSTSAMPSENPPAWKHYVTPGPNVQPPQVLSSSEPATDASAQRPQHKTYHARARLRLGVNDQGNVEKVEIVRKVGYGLDEKAVEAVRTWKFRPAMLNGRPVPSQVYVDINFKLTQPPLKQ